MDKKNFALVNCTVIDGRLTSLPIEKAVILVKNLVEGDEKPGIFTAVGRRQDTPIPKSYQIIDLQGKYVLPGLINAHCHIIADGRPSTSSAGKWIKVLVWLAKTPPGKIIALNMMRTNALNELNSGVTTLRSAGEPFFYDVIIRKEIEQGKWIGPRILVAGPGILPTGGHGAGFFNTADGPWQVRKQVRNNIHHEVDLIKILSTGGVSDSKVIGEAGRPQMDPVEIEAACIEAHRAGLMVATHAQSMQGVKEALQAGVDTIEHGSDLDEEIAELFKHNPKALRGFSVLVPTFSAPQAIMDHMPEGKMKLTPVQVENSKIVMEGMVKGFKAALKHGVKTGVGNDASIPYVTHYAFWKELAFLVQFDGISNQHAIHLATLNNAKILGIKKETGSIEASKSADFVVVDGNPLKNLAVLARPVMVCARGNLIEKPKIKKVRGVD